MAVECPKELFEFFEKKCGDFARPTEKESQSFLYDALAEGFIFSDVIQIQFPKLDDKTFNDWGKFESWCEDINVKSMLMWDIVDEKISNNEFDETNKTPKIYFGSKKAVKEKIINAVCTSDSDDIEPVVYVEIQHDGKKLFLRYFDQDSWTLGWGDTVYVFNSLDELSITNGYFPRKLDQ